MLLQLRAGRESTTASSPPWSDEDAPAKESLRGYLRTLLDHLDDFFKKADNDEGEAFDKNEFVKFIKATLGRKTVTTTTTTEAPVAKAPTTTTKDEDSTDELEGDDTGGDDDFEDDSGDDDQGDDDWDDDEGE